jgi:CubicO group peptidase (beta-lactamase class C family)
MLKATAALSAVLALTLPRTDPVAQTVPDRYRQRLQPLLERVIQEQKLPGFAIAVVEDNRVAYAAGFGVRNLTRKDDPITTRSLFHMASITKPFVATSLMQLVEGGKVDLDTPVVKYLPYFRIADERYTTITVRQMVTHTSGMPDVDDYEWDKPQYDDGALERYVRSLGTFRLVFAPGTQFRYSNMAFEILGDVVAKVSGETFDDYVQRHILAPLAMKDSTLLVKQADPALLAWSHEMSERRGAFPSRVYPYNRMHTPSSNLHSNVLDMARWTIANMNRGELDGARILRTSTYDVMWKPAAVFDGKPSPTGISWFLGEYRGTRLVTHGGGDTGFRTFLALLPERKIATVWMTNADWFHDPASVTHAALDTALGLERMRW